MLKSPSHRLAVIETVHMAPKKILVGQYTTELYTFLEVGGPES